MDINREARIVRLAKYLAIELKKTSGKAYWIGIAIGLVMGFIAGVAIGYSMGSPQTIVIPLEPGVEV